MLNNELLNLSYEEFEKHIISEIEKNTPVSDIKKLIESLPNENISKKFISNNRENKITQIIK